MRVATTFLMLATLAVFSTSAPADWNLGDPSKWVQTPDLRATGMDVNATWSGLFPYVKVLADDFLCYTPGDITGIHIWGSWLNDTIDESTRIKLSIHKDVPAGIDAPYSHPGEELWQKVFLPEQYVVKPWGQAVEHFYDPNTNEMIGQDFTVWQYNFWIPQQEAFRQKGTNANPIIYWLDVQALVRVPSGPQGPVVFGWKTSQDNWHDGAVFADTEYFTGPPVGPAPPPVFWQKMISPLTQRPFDMAFVINSSPIPGDANLDGWVLFNDYQVLEQHFGMTTGAQWGNGDFDGDGDVDFADYQILEQHFGEDIPEPCALAVMCGAGIPALLKRRRRG